MHPDKEIPVLTPNSDFIAWYNEIEPALLNTNSDDAVKFLFDKLSAGLIRRLIRDRRIDLKCVTSATVIQALFTLFKVDAVTEFEQRRQLPGETLTDYYETIRDMAFRSNLPAYDVTDRLQTGVLPTRAKYCRMTNTFGEL